MGSPKKSLFGAVLDLAPGEALLFAIVMIGNMGLELYAQGEYMFALLFLGLTMLALAYRTFLKAYNKNK